MNRIVARRVSAWVQAVLSSSLAVVSFGLIATILSRKSSSGTWLRACVDCLVDVVWLIGDGDGEGRVGVHHCLASCDSNITMLHIPIFALETDTGALLGSKK